MKQLIAACLLSLTYSISVMSQSKTIQLRVIETSDVHGSFFPYDFINRKPKAGSMARVSNYVRRLREEYGDRLLLLDNGDILQGQPVCYYYNYIDRNATNIAAEVTNYMGYDAQTLGNHDGETGHSVYDKWIAESRCPMLGANVTDTQTGQPYLKPYAVIERQGVRIAILGLITPAIPNWLSGNLWSRLRCDDMVSAARLWMERIRRDAHPDVVIGLFHSGKQGGITTPTYEENAALRVAREVPGFDLVLFGHDHTPYAGTITSADNRQVVCLDPANDAYQVADATITITRSEEGTATKVHGQLADVRHEPIDEDFMAHFAKHIKRVSKFVDKRIGRFKHTISTRDCYFGSSAFNDLILNLELQITGADIAFNAPLSLDAQIEAGDVHVSDMFNLYKFENQLYVMRLTGEEIRRHLEMSYDLWVNTMRSPDDHLLLLSQRTRNDQQRMGFQNFSFNFDSAAGIDYEVDVTQENGHKVRILRMSDGRPFDPDRWYRVAVNSYRGNGGGELLTRGAGIPQDSLESRIVWRSELDQRYYLMQEIKRQRTLDPKPNHNWRFVPEAWVEAAAKRDYELLFGTSKNEEK